MAKQSAKTTYPNLFKTPDDTTDVVFVVGEERIHFNKAVLSMVSPVFKKMFTSEFKEKNAVTVPLPGKTLKDMVLFLEQIHPAHSAKPITDETLPIILKLADEYQAETVRQKCSQYIGTQTELKYLQESLSDDLLLLYLWMCEQYGLKEHRERLLALGIDRKSTELIKCKVFRSVPSSASIELLTRRNARLEDGVNEIWTAIQSRSERGCHRNMRYHNQCTLVDCCDNCAFSMAGSTIESIGGLM